MRRVSVLGATGSIGQSTVDLLIRDKSAYDVVALTGGRNIEQLAKDAIALGASYVATCYDALYLDLKQLLSGHDIEVGAGVDAILEAAARPCDWCMSSIIGAAGLAPSLKALEHTKILALANKESLVTAGPLLLETAQRTGATILPVDSEHSAVFQALVGEDKNAVEQVVITASGGAFRDWSLEDMAKATPEQAAVHPNWSMGQRITVDSASMFNKAMELIETKEFFGFSPRKIKAVIHPESLVHALVGFQDGAMMAHLGAPDMRHAIGFALNWPERAALPVQKVDLVEIGQLNFQAIDQQRYPAIRIAQEVMDAGGYSGAAFNAAKERALDAFLARDIGFLDMSHIVEQTLDVLGKGPQFLQNLQGLSSILDMDQMARRCAEELIFGNKAP